MTRIIPAILARDEQEFRKRVATATALVSSGGIGTPMIHLDVLDGSLFPERSFANIERLKTLRLSLPFGVHLMVHKPEETVQAWIKLGAARVIIHREAQGNLGLALERIRHANREAGISLNPETDLRALDEFIPFIHYIQVMGVQPGAMGRPFNPDTIGRVRALRAAYPHLKIGVDGGVTAKKHLAHELAVAGADELIVGSALWASDNPAAAFEEIVVDASLKS